MQLTSLQISHIAKIVQVQEIILEQHHYRPGWLITHPSILFSSNKSSTKYFSALDATQNTSETGHQIQVSV